MSPSGVPSVNWVREDREEKPPIYWYKSPPGPIALEGMQVQQKGRTFYVVSSSAVDLDRLCSVPVIRYETSNADVALDATSTYVKRWQRELNADRTREIARFFANPQNLLVNTALIGLPESVTFHTNAALRSACSIPINWVKKQCPLCKWHAPDGHPHTEELFDTCPSCTWEGRPGQIIDGQHRIRGCASAGAPVWDEKLVASVLVEGQFLPMDEAKIFTEITTSAVDLHDLHKVYLLYKFGLRSTAVGALDDADFRKDPAGAGQHNTLGLRNRRAYEIACDLVSKSSSRWHDRISMFPGPEGKARKGDVINADALVYFCEPWLKSGPLVDQSQADKMVTASVAATHLRDFVESALSIWPVGRGTPGGTSSSFWFDGRQKNGWLQFRGIFEVFLSLFEVTSRRILAHGGTPTRSAYHEEISYIETINWDDPSWHDLAAPDKNKYLLRRILEHLYANAPYPVGGNRAPPRVNTWIHERPDEITFTTRPPRGTPLAAVSLASPMKLTWDCDSPFSSTRIPKPVNAYDTAVVLLEQDQAGGKTVILDQAETILNSYQLLRAPRELDTTPSAGPVRVSVTYTNPNGPRTQSFSHPAI